MSVKTLKGPQKVKLDGEKLISKCEKHGEYTAQILFTQTRSGRPICTICPKCEEAERIEDNKRAEAEAAEMAKRRLYAAQIPRRFQSATFENYCAETPEQRQCLERCKRYAEAFADRRKAGGGLVLVGQPGTGKSHLGCAILRAIIDAGFSGRFLPAVDLFTMTKQSFTTGADIFQQLRRPDLVVLDDVGVGHNSEAEKLWLHGLVNERYMDVKPTILISNLNENDLTAHIGERAIDRMREGGGAVLAFSWESFRAAKK